MIGYRFDHGVERSKPAKPPIPSFLWPGRIRPCFLEHILHSKWRFNGLF